MRKLFVGLDVSNATTSVCVIDETNMPVFEGKADTTPDAIARALAPFVGTIDAVGLEAGVLARWLHAGLTAHGLPVACIDARHAHTTLAAQRHKSDRNDALGIARLMKSGWIKPAHLRSEEAARLRAVLVFRRTLQRKSVDLEVCLRHTLKVFGIQLGVVSRAKFEERLGEALAGHAILASMSREIVEARSALLKARRTIDARLSKLAASDDICQRLMTAPGVGPITALTFKAMVDDPGRFRKSRSVGVYFGLTPRRNQSGEHDGFGSISKRGDMQMRALLCLSAGLLLRSKRDSRLKRWGLALAHRSKKGLAYVAVARRLSAVLHQIWITNGQFEPGLEGEA